MPGEARAWSVQRRWFTSAASTLRLDESADLLGRGEDDVGAVAHHPGAYECRRSLLGTVAAAVGLEPKIALPKSVLLPVGGGHAIRVAAIADGLNTILGVERLEIGIAAAHLPALLSCLSGQCSPRLC